MQELLVKYDKISNSNWHFIGRLQTNKVKKIIDKVDLIQSVDSIKLAKEIDKRAFENNKIMDILLQINIANEETKTGFTKQEIFKAIDILKDFKNIKVKGLMCIAPFVENYQNNKEYFKQMKKLFIDINIQNKDNIYIWRIFLWVCQMII